MKPWGIIATHEGGHARATAITGQQAGYVVVGAHSTTASAEQRGWVRRFANDGTLTWSQNGDDREWIPRAVVADEGQVWVAGEQRIDERRAYRALLLSLDAADGTVVWTREIGATGATFFDAIVPAGGGAVLCAGEQAGTGWMARVEGSGEVTWERSIQGTNRLTGLARNDGGFVATGLTERSPVRMGGAVVIGLDEQGAESWRLSAHDGPSELAAVATTETGSVCVGRFAREQGTGLLVAEITTGGELGWQYLGDGNLDAGQAVAVTGAGELIVAGVVQPNPGQRRACLWLLDSGGRLVRQNVADDSGRGLLSGVVVLAGDRIVAVGTAESDGKTQELVMESNAGASIAPLR